MILPEEYSSFQKPFPFSHNADVHSVEIPKFYTHTILTKISGKQVFTTEVAKELISRNIFGETKFFVFPLCDAFL